MGNEIKHTPGPWKCEPRPDEWDDDDPAFYITHPATQCPDTTIVNLDNEADARLIAAAPDLLEALERSLSWLSSYPGGNALNCYNQARAAISKARGENHD